MRVDPRKNAVRFAGHNSGLVTTISRSEEDLDEARVSTQAQFLRYVAEPQVLLPPAVDFVGEIFCERLDRVLSEDRPDTREQCTVHNAQRLSLNRVVAADLEVQLATQFVRPRPGQDELPRPQIVSRRLRERFVPSALQVQHEHFAPRLQSLLERLRDRHVAIKHSREDLRRSFGIGEHGPRLALHMALQHRPAPEPVFPGDDEERLRLGEGRRPRRHVCSNPRSRAVVGIVERSTQRLGFVFR